MEQWFGVVADIGFPIAVTFYLLTRIEGKLDGLTSTIFQLDQTLSKWLENSE